jgi:hypothetical protein
VTQNGNVTGSTGNVGPTGSTGSATGAVGNTGGTGNTGSTGATGPTGHANPFPGANGPLSASGAIRWAPPNYDPGIAGAVWNANGGTGICSMTGGAGPTGAWLKISSGGATI